MLEPVRGQDSVFLHYEDANARAHTLKCLVLDHGRRGQPLTLDEVRAVIGPRLGWHPRARQRVLTAPVLRGRHVWADDPTFDLDDHLAERVLASDPRAFDRLCSELATRPMDLSRPLWDLTLVHGLPDDRQALVFRIHHTLSDGMAAANMLQRFTSDEPGDLLPPIDDWWAPSPLPSRRDVLVDTLRATPAYATKVARFSREVIAQRPDRKRVSEEIRKRDDLLGDRPQGTKHWTSVKNQDPRRLAASGQLPFDDLRSFAKAHDVTVNTALLAVLGRAVELESDARGDPIGAEVAGFSIAMDPNTDRIMGNDLRAIFTSLRPEVADVGERMRAINVAVRDSAQMWRSILAHRQVRIPDVAVRLLPVGVRVGTHVVPKINAHFICANVRGPDHTRWLGDLEVVDFISWAVVIPPVGLNITVYSYAGHLSIGLLTTPEVTDDPHRLIARIEQAAAELYAS